MRPLVTFLALSALPLSANQPGGGPSSGGGDVSLVDQGATVTLANGTLTAVIGKDNAKIHSILFNGVQLVRPGGDIYYSMDGGTHYRQPSGCTYSITTRTADMVDIGMRQTWSTQAQPLDIEIHYVLRRGDSGIYTYALLDHPGSYPAGGYGEWRFVWKLPDDTFENLFVDELRSRRMPTAADYSIASPTPIAEVLHLNSGVLAGEDEGKYCYATRYYDTPAWGHASNVNNTGVWLVFGSHEYLNDGPFKQDLAPAAGILHAHFGMNHYHGSTLSLAEGEAWKKIYGPFLLYCNAHPAGALACWEDAKAQAVAESAAWPYEWLTGDPSYPNATQRAKVTGTLQLNDPIKPTIGPEGAWVGLAQPEAGGNFQFESKGYQHWVKAGPDGHFTLSDVRPGTYTLYAVATGEAGEFESSTEATVGAGQSLDLGAVSWSIPRSGSWMAWEIGLPDRDSREFRHGDDFWVPFRYHHFDNKFPNPLTYDVSSSIASRDWNYAQPGYQPDGGPLTTWPWQVRFDLPEVPESGSARLHLAFAGSHYARMNVYVNGSNPIGSPGFFYVDSSRGNALLRQSSHAKYAYHTIEIPVSLLRAGSNRITITQAKVDDISMHVMYDYLGLEMPALSEDPPEDADGDGLADAWEQSHFLTLSPSAAEDPDGDGYNNGEEYHAGSDPKNDSSLPSMDDDGDLMNDLWELKYYPSLGAAGPLDDSDEDGANTWMEWKAGTDPTDPESLPGSATHGTMAIEAVADCSVFHRDGFYPYNSTNYGTAGQLDTSQFGAGIWAMSYVRFDLNSLPAGAVIDSASLRLVRQSTLDIAGFPVVRNDAISTGRFGCFGLLDVPGNTSQTWDETSLTGDSIGLERIRGGNPQFDTSTSRTTDFNSETETVHGGADAIAGGSSVILSGGRLMSFLQDRLDSPSDSGLATLIIDFMEDSTASARGYSFASRENVGNLDPPRLLIDYSATIPEPDPDEDADGLRDAWEAHHFGSLTVSGDDDSDGDGTPEWLEESMGMDPTDPGSSFRTTLTPPIDNAFRLHWRNAAGVTFSVESSANLSPPWVTEATLIGSRVPGELEYSVPTGSGNRYYRIRAERP